MDTKICNKCGKEKPLNQFVKKSSSSDGYSSQCKDCRHEYYKKYYTLNKIRILEKHKQYKRSLHNHVHSLKEEGCIICGEKDIACLDFHHLCDKSYNISTEYKNKGFKTIDGEASKCVVLCANCHRKLHYYKLTIEQLKLHI